MIGVRLPDPHATEHPSRDQSGPPDVLCAISHDCKARRRVDWPTHMMSLQPSRNLGISVVLARPGTSLLLVLWLADAKWLILITTRSSASQHERTRCKGDLQRMPKLGFLFYTDRTASSLAGSLAVVTVHGAQCVCASHDGIARSPCSCSLELSSMITRLSAQCYPPIP